MLCLGCHFSEVRLNQPCFIQCLLTFLLNAVKIGYLRLRAGKRPAELCPPSLTSLIPQSARWKGMAWG